MKNVFKAIQQLIGYLLIGLPFLPPLLLTIPWFKRSRTIKNIWIFYDCVVCFIAHGQWRTISGLTGERMTTSRRYLYQGLFINKGAELLGDKPKHCERTHKYEVSKKVKEYTAFLVKHGFIKQDIQGC